MVNVLKVNWKKSEAIIICLIQHFETDVKSQNAEFRNNPQSWTFDIQIIKFSVCQQNINIFKLTWSMF